VANFKELDKRINYQVQQVNHQQVRIEKLESQITEFNKNSHQAQTLFTNIIEVIKKNTTFILTNKKDLKSAIAQIQEAMS
jgi:hypothetical protein